MVGIKFKRKLFCFPGWHRLSFGWLGTLIRCYCCGSYWWSKFEKGQRYYFKTLLGVVLIPGLMGNIVNLKNASASFVLIKPLKD